MLNQAAVKTLTNRLGRIIALVVIGMVSAPSTTQAQTTYDLSQFIFEFSGGSGVQATLETEITGTLTTEAEIEEFLNSSIYLLAFLYGNETVFSLDNSNSSWDLVLHNDAAATLTIMENEMSLDFETPNASSTLSLNSSADLSLCSPDKNKCLTYSQRNSLDGGENTVRIEFFDENNGSAEAGYDEPFVFPELKIYSAALPFNEAYGGVTINGNRVEYSGNPTGWRNNFATSSNLEVKDNFEVRFLIDSDPENSLWVVGLGLWSNEPRWQEIGHVIRNSNGRMMVFESGEWRASGPYLSRGDVVSIDVNLGVTEYAHNGEVVYSSGSPGDPSAYRSVAAMFKNGAAALNASILSRAPFELGGKGITAWLNTTGGVTTWNRDGLEYSGSPTGWVNSINSVPFSWLGVGEEYQVTWTLFPYMNYGTWVVGLGVAENRSNWRDVDYAIRNSNGVLSIYESGNYIKPAGTLTFEGDQMAIQVLGSRLNYVVNNTIIHSREIADSDDLYIDTSFKEGEARLINFRLRYFDMPAPPESTPLSSWANAAGGVTFSNNSLTYSGAPTGWSNSVNSARLADLGAGSTYEVTWTVGSDPSSSLWVVGMGTSESGNRWRELDVALRNIRGKLYVYVDGEYRTTLGDLRIGDELMLRVNESCFDIGYNSARTRAVCRNTTEAVENLYINALFKFGAAELSQFEITRE